MKIIEAMKRIKRNEEKTADLQNKIRANSAYISLETPEYDGKKIREWLQSCTDLTQENAHLLVSIQRTNLATAVTIELGGKQVTKSIAEWVWRRRKYAEVDMHTWTALTDKGLRSGEMKITQTGQPVSVSVIRLYDPEERDNRVSMYREEPSIIDATLEVINATTDLIEA